MMRTIRMHDNMRSYRMQKEKKQCARPTLAHSTDPKTLNWLYYDKHSVCFIIMPGSLKIQANLLRLNLILA